MSGVHVDSGYEYKYGAMANALYDIDLGWLVTPYVGAGVGVESVGIDGGAITYPDAFIRLDHPQLSFAYQVIAGVAAPLFLPGLSLTAEYRFMSTVGDRKSAGSISPAGSSVRRRHGSAATTTRRR